MAAEKKMLSIWHMVGIVLSLYGGIITSVGIYYSANPDAIKSHLSDLNPPLWWGIIMLVFGMILLISAIISSKKG